MLLLIRALSKTPQVSCDRITVELALIHLEGKSNLSSLLNRVLRAVLIQEAIYSDCLWLEEEA